MKKKVLLIVSGAAVLLLGAGFGGQAWLKGRLQKDSLVAQMEEMWNCRAQLDSTSVSLFSRPATVKLIGLKLAPRDDEVAKPLGERAPLAPGSAEVSASEVVLSVQLGELLHGTLNVERLHIDGLDVRNEIDKHGNGSLDALFKSPNAVEVASDEPEADAPPVIGSGGSTTPTETKDAVPDAASSAEEPGGAKPRKPKKAPKPAHVPMKASQMRVDLAVKSAGISSGRFEAIDLKGDTKTVFEHINLALTDIDVASGNLASHDSAKFNLAAAMRLEKTDEKLVVADFTVEGSGSIQPFDPKTGEWRPDMDLNVLLRKGGLVGGMTLENQINKKELKQLTDVGFDLGDIAFGGILAQDATSQIHALPGGKLIVKSKTTFAFPEYVITLNEGSWFNPTEDSLNVSATSVVSQKLSERILENAKKVLDAKMGLGALGNAGIDVLSKALMDNEKRLVLPYRGKGKLSHPQIDFGGLFRDLLKNSGKNLLEQLFKTTPDSGGEKPGEKPEEKR